MTEPPVPAVPAGSADPSAVQAGLAADRARLLGGRGPGASQAEIDQHTRARPQLAGEPTPRHLEAVARQTAIARGDAAAVALDIAAAREQLALTVGAIRDKVSPRQAITRRMYAARTSLRADQNRWGTGGSNRAAGAAAGLALAAVMVVALRHRRSAGSARRAKPTGRRVRMPPSRGGSPRRRW